jgi:hypothetical protein
MCDWERLPEPTPPPVPNPGISEKRSRHGVHSGHPENCFGCKIRTLTFGHVSRNKVEEAVMPDGHRVKATTGTDGSIHIEYHDKEHLVVPNRTERGTA